MAHRLSTLVEEVQGLILDGTNLRNVLFQIGSDLGAIGTAPVVDINVIWLRIVQVQVLYQITGTFVSHFLVFMTFVYTTFF